jgi:uncharacterized membrane protein YhaH (DUF805 family)
MFKRPFSFEGRIRRTEYGLSLVIYAICAIILNIMVEVDEETFILLFAYIPPMFWFLWAQSTKQCHDIGKSGWWQFIPFYILWLLFQDGQHTKNQYGDTPKISRNSR